MDASTLMGQLGDPGLRVVDCRFLLLDPEAGRAHYREAHIPGAVYADLDRDLSAPVTAESGRHPLPSVAAMAARLGDWGVDRTTDVLVYDAGDGSIAARLWWLLRWLGHDAVWVLDGGFQAWVAEGGDTEDGDTLASAKEFQPRASRYRAVSTDALVRGLDSGSMTLVDARSGERFRGEHEPIDPVAGHVPGALSQPHAENLQPSGLMRSPVALRELWSQRLGGIAPESVVHMCGSGVTACHNLLAMERAGLGGSVLYPGSWSEWIRDPGRPRATGAK